MTDESVHILTIFIVASNSFGEGNGNPLQYSCLENPMDGEAWWATVRGVTKSQTRLSDFAFTFKTGRSPSTAPLHQKHKLTWWSPQAITWRLGTGEAAQGAHPRAFDCVVLQQHCNSHEYYLRSLVPGRVCAFHKLHHHTLRSFCGAAGSIITSVLECEIQEGHSLTLSLWSQILSVLDTASGVVWDKAWVEASGINLWDVQAHTGCYVARML